MEQKKREKGNGCALFFLAKMKDTTKHFYYIKNKYKIK